MADPMASFINQLARDGGPALRNSMTFRESAIGFFHAIDWTERNVLLLLSAHVALLAAVLSTRRSVEAQFVLLLLMAAGVYASQHFNAAMAASWRAWGWSQNYFDKGGVFVMSMVTAPLLCVMVLQVVLLLAQANELLVVLKRHQLRAQHAGQGAGAGGGSPGVPADYDDLPKKTM